MSDVLRSCLRHYVDSHLTEARRVLIRTEPPQAADPASVVVERGTARFVTYHRTPLGRWRRDPDIAELPLTEIPATLLRYVQNRDEDEGENEE